jgi:hypothetical protein
MLLGLCIFSPPSYAIPLSNLLAGGTIVIDDKSFESWRNYISVGVNGALAVDPVDIDVSSIGAGTGNPGLVFTSNAFVVGPSVVPQTQVTTFDFDVRVIGGANVIKDNSLEMTQFVAPVTPPSIFVTETKRDAGGGMIATLTVNNSMPTASADFSPQNFITIAKNVTLVGTMPTQQFRVNQFTQRFSQLPEPSTIFLLGTGLIGLAFAWRLRKK